MAKNVKLFAEFPPVSTQQWEEVINADLKGADYEKKLVWKTMEGFAVRPYYRTEDLAQIKHLSSKPGEFPYVRGTKADNNWLVRQTIKVENPKEANAKALDVLMRGAESLCFEISNKEFSAAELNTLLAGIDLKAIETNFSGCATKVVAKLFIEKIKSEKLNGEDVRASFAIDPIVKKLAKKGSFGCSDDQSKAINEIKEIILSLADYKRIRVATVSADVFSNSGSTIVEELAFALSAGHEYIVELVKAGLTIDQVASRIKFNMAVSSNYFMEIAKFRAARMLWAQIIEAYAPKCSCAPKMKIAAITSMWNMTVYDPYVNMLRGTTEAMSASIAGVDSLEVLPFDAAYEQPTEFSSRIARNAQLLLKEESHFDQVADAAGGSYYIEILTKSIADAAWTLFKDVEDKGGYIEAFKAGFIQDKIEESAAKKDMNIATRRQILLGTNQYPNFTETADASIPAEAVLRSPAKCKCCCSNEAAPKYKQLKPYRGAMAFEELRLKTDRSGKTPVAFMLTLGNLAFARARAQFACNFFACAGFKTVDNNHFASVEQGVKAAMDAKAQLVVVCSSDDEYATLVPEVAQMLNGKATVVVAGEPACKAELEAKGITKFISVKSNVLQTLKEYQKELGI